jgi:vitamin B12 transporter
VNLTTIEPTEQLSANAHAEYGWRDTRELVGNVSQKIGPVSASLGVGDFRTDGLSAFSEQRGATERDPYRNFGAHAKFNVALSEDVSVDLRGWYSNGKVGIDGFPAPNFTFADTREYARTREFVGYTALNVALFDGRLHNRLATAYTETKRGNFDPDGFLLQTFDANGRNARVEYQGILDITDAVRATFGAETEHSRFTTASFGGPPTQGEADISSGYAELLVRPLTGLTATIGVRHDHHDEFGGKTTAGASAAWTPNDGLTVLRASYSEGFKAPTLYQLQSEFGNGLLQPETARGWDAGVTQRLLGDKIELTATAFQRNSRDLINFVSCSAPFDGICTNRPFGTYDNVSRARAQGLELAVVLKPIEALTAQANFTHVKAEDRSAGSTTFGKDLVRRPGETLSALLDYRWPFGLDTGATLTHVSSSFDNASNTQRVEGYDVVDLRVAYPVTDKVELQARVENLTDEKYETVFRYGTPGRSTFVGVRLSY